MKEDEYSNLMLMTKEQVKAVMGLGRNKYEKPIWKYRIHDKERPLEYLELTLSFMYGLKVILITQQWKKKRIQKQ